MATKPTVKAKPKEPALTEVSVSYSSAVKCNIGNYESADYHLSKRETFNVEGLDPVAVAKFCDERYELLKEELDDRIMAIYAETSTMAG